MNKIKPSIIDPFYSASAVLCSYGLGAFYKIKEHQQPKGNILLIPGIMQNRFTLRPLGAFLNQQGYNVYFPKLGWNIWNVDKQANKVNQFWKKVKSGQDLPFYVLGHSMGGLIAHYWIKNYKIKPSKLITLGTPFLGSKAIYWGAWYFFPAAKWIKPKQKTAAYIIKKSSFKQVNIATREDLLVERESALCSEIKSPKILLKNVGGHAGLIINIKKMGETVLELIE